MALFSFCIASILESIALISLCIASFLESMALFSALISALISFCIASIFKSTARISFLVAFLMVFTIPNPVLSVACSLAKMTLKTLYLSDSSINWRLSYLHPFLKILVSIAISHLCFALNSTEVPMTVSYACPMIAIKKFKSTITITKTFKTQMIHP